MEEAADELERLRQWIADLEQVWISVEEWLPDAQQAVVFYAPEVGYHTGRYYPNEGCWVSAGGFLCGGEVTYWCPLPPAPEEDNNDS
jgi:hypothetical protein